MKKIISILVLGVLVVGFAFTSGGKEKDDKINLTVWTLNAFKGVWASSEDGAAYGDFMKYAAEEFMKQNDNINIEVAVYVGDDRSKKIGLAAQTGTLPNIIFDTSFGLMDYAHAGILEPINDIISSDNINDIGSGIWENVTIRDNVYMYPFCAENGHMAINVDLFKEAGCEEYIPEEQIGEWTPEEFADTLRALKKGLPSDVYPFAFYCGNQVGDTWNNLLLRMFGADFFNEDTSEVILNSGEGIKALDFLLNLQDEGLIAPGAESLFVNDILQMFLNQKTAISIFNIISYNNYNAGVAEGAIEPFEYKWTYIPNSEGNACFTYVMGSAVCKVGNEATIDAAKKFVEFMSTGEFTAASKIMLPVRKSVAVTMDNPELSAVVNSLEYSLPFNQNAPGYANLRAVLFPELQAAFTGAKSSKEALDSYVAAANKILAEKYAESKILK